jgi:hypothetical protein
MKIAYIGYDLSSVKTQEFFNSKELEVTYFLVHPKTTPQHATFRKTNLLVDQIMIPAEHNLQTVAHKNSFHKIKKNYKIIENEISGDASVVEKGQDRKFDEKGNSVQELKNIIDIQYNTKAKKILIEIEKSGVEEYDFILTEPHALISSELKKRNIQLFKKSLQSNSVWSSFHFQVEYKKSINFLIPGASFFMVMDSERDSVNDNWFHCVLINNKLQVSSFQPYSQMMNPEFQTFAAARIQKQITERLHFIQIVKFEETSLSTIAANYRSSQLDMKPSAAVPNFAFWNYEQINLFLDKQIIRKINKVQQAIAAAQSEVKL